MASKAATDYANALAEVIFAVMAYDGARLHEAKVNLAEALDALLLPRKACVNCRGTGVDSEILNVAGDRNYFPCLLCGGTGKVNQPG